jgi:hypothetical protein
MINIIAKIHKIDRLARLLKQQTSITVYRLPTKENKLPFSVSSVFRIYICILKRQHILYRYVCIDRYISILCIYIYIYIISISIYIYIYICIYTPVSNGKWKPRRFSLIRLPFAHRANGSLSVSPFVSEETNGSYLIPNGLNELAHHWKIVSSTGLYFP